MVNENELHQVDPELAALINKESDREDDTLELIASENFTSPAVLKAMGSVLTNKYAEGYPGRRYYGGCAVVDEVENLARTRLLGIFGGEHANVQPHSGTQANTAVYFAMLKPGDTVLGMALDQGGHLTHGHPLNFSGKYFRFVPYGVRKEDERIDYDAIAALAENEKPKMIVAGASAYSRIIDFPRLRAIADSCGALLMVDMAHIAGLVAAGCHPTPVPHADFVTSTTHKTLRGPRGGLIICRGKYAKEIDKAVFPGIQGGPLMHVIAAKAVCFKEAATPEFKAYQQAVVVNARVLGETLSAGGLRPVSGGTDNHLLLVDVGGKGHTGKTAEARLELAHLACNKNTIPFDPKPPMVASGIRLGSPALTSRGFTAAEFIQVGKIICNVLSAAEGDEKTIAEARGMVKELCVRFPLYHRWQKEYEG